jgi:hypothetical protein
MFSSQRIGLCVILSLVASCNTTETLERASTGSGRAFHLSAECGLAASLLVPAMSRLGIRIESQRPIDDCGIEVIGSRPITVLSWGELVRARIVPTPDGADLVIYTKRVVTTNVAARRDWAMPIYQALVNEIEKSPPGNTQY